MYIKANLKHAHLYQQLTIANITYTNFYPSTEEINGNKIYKQTDNNLEQTNAKIQTNANLILQPSPIQSSPLQAYSTYKPVKTYTLNQCKHIRRSTQLQTWSTWVLTQPAHMDPNTEQINGDPTYWGWWAQEIINQTCPSKRHRPRQLNKTRGVSQNHTC